MHQESIFRQVALVSYGTKFLSDKLALENWYQHGIFFGARLQFRALADNALLADDFSNRIDDSMRRKDEHEGLDDDRAQ